MASGLPQPVSTQVPTNIYWATSTPCCRSSIRTHLPVCGLYASTESRSPPERFTRNVPRSTTSTWGDLDFGEICSGLIASDALGATPSSAQRQRLL